MTFVLAAMVCYSGYRLFGIRYNYAQEAEMHSSLMPFRPTSQALPIYNVPSYTSTLIVNQSIIDLQTKYPDIIGWLTIPNTRVDYPFAQSADNDFYLYRDLDANRSQAGTIFMDFRNNNDFSDFSTILFGHNMRNGSMFGTLQSFNNATFFDENRTGIIFLANKTYNLEFIAFAVIGPNDLVIYNPNITTETDKIAFAEHVRNIARHYRNIDITIDDQIIILSTCSYEFDNARMVLIGRIRAIC